MTDQYRQKYLTQLKQVQGINIQAFPLYDCHKTGVKMEVPVLFRIMIGDHSHLIKRRPIHICLVLDRSGSMAGTPLQSCKKAVKQVIGQLGIDDKVSFIAYDDKAEVIFTHQTIADYDRIVPLIDQVDDCGCTNIFDGLSTAARILNQGEPGRENGVTPQYQKIVFLFSDGEANRGITDLDELGKHIAHWVDNDGIHFSSFGIGDNYNETWMRSIARGGEGNYFFIDRMENIPHLVEKGLSGFTQVIGDHVNFRVSGVNGHFLTSLQNDKTIETLSNGKKIPYLRNLGLYQFLANVEINGVPQGGNYEQCVLEAVLSFDTQPELAHKSIKKEVILNFSDDQNQCNLEKNKDVVCYQVIGECAKINHLVDAAMKKYQTKDAINLKNLIIAKYENVLSFDQFGLIGALLDREKKTLTLLEEEGLSSKTTKTQEYTTSYGYYCTTTTKKTDWETKKKENIDEDVDMGYGLFD